MDVEEVFSRPGSVAKIPEGLPTDKQLILTHIGIKDFPTLKEKLILEIKIFFCIQIWKILNDIHFLTAHCPSASQVNVKFSAGTIVLLQAICYVSRLLL